MYNLIEVSPIDGRFKMLNPIYINQIDVTTQKDEDSGEVIDITVITYIKGPFIERIGVKETPRNIQDLIESSVIPTNHFHSIE